ncbi:hypothetical protein WICPIJ_006997 [Wickerhamomyces pijperi]|uniref:ATP-dependent DNA helicase PIF1 n=1 Tax=Wickerhamomyces pijperi TaxID=599730 RepID=A0A9P8Q2R3_WICPI|nr:hypothetical protein WICPIJ_006997 [Wickerhamomyces pijperi]
MHTTLKNRTLPIRIPLRDYSQLRHQTAILSKIPIIPRLYTSNKKQLLLALRRNFASLPPSVLQLKANPTQVQMSKPVLMDRSFLDVFNDSWEGDDSDQMEPTTTTTTGAAATGKINHQHKQLPPKPATIHLNQQSPTRSISLSSPLKPENQELIDGIDFDESFSSDDDTNTTKILDSKKIDPLRGEKRQQILADIFDDSLSSEDEAVQRGADLKRAKTETPSSSSSFSKQEIHQKTRETTETNVQEQRQEDDPFGDDDDDFKEIFSRPLMRNPSPYKSTASTIATATVMTTAASATSLLPSNPFQAASPAHSVSHRNFSSKSPIRNPTGKRSTSPERKPVNAESLDSPSKIPDFIDLTLDSQDEDATPSPLPKKPLYPEFIQALPRIPLPSLTHADSSISINAPESSSPAHHRTATTGARVQLGAKALYPDMSGFTELPPLPPLPDTSTNYFDNMVRTSTNLEDFLPPQDLQQNALFVTSASDVPNPPDYLNEFSIKESNKKSTANVNREMLFMTQKPTIASALKMDTKEKEEVQKKLILEPLEHKVVKPIVLSQEQQNVIELILKGSSVFYTGSAGTGKSILLRALITRLRQKYAGSPGAIGVCASTGLAACNISGLTLHSYTGVGLATEDVDALVKKIKRSKKHSERWRNLKVLVIDEISMIDGKLFDKLDEIACRIRRNDEPWGGVQVVCCGDFFQLPPVSKEHEAPAMFCFESEAWKRTIKHTIVLKTVFRQKGDLEFIDMLNEMRLGKVSPESEKKFRALERPLPFDDVETAELFSTRAEVEKANNLRLRNLRTEEMIYNSIDGGAMPSGPTRETLLANMIAPRKLTLKKGAQVMMLKNLDENLVNGSLGKVIDFIDKDTYMTYQKVLVDSDHGLDFLQEEIEKNNLLNESLGLPPRVGANQEVNVLEDTVFDFLLDAKSEDPVIQEEIYQKKLLMKKLNESSRGSKLPLVKFLTPDGQTRCVLVVPETWTVDDDKQQPLVSRLQLPLMLAWAISIHKSQGQTMPRVKVNLRRVFEKGQVYVAISRAVSRDGLQVLNFDPYKVLAHEKVTEFYKALSSIDQINKDHIAAMEVKANTSDPGIFNAGLTRQGIARDNSKRMKPRENTVAANGHDVIKARERPSTTFQRRSATTPRPSIGKSKARPASHIQEQTKRHLSTTSSKTSKSKPLRFADIIDLEAEECNDNTSMEDVSNSITENTINVDEEEDNSTLDQDEESLSFVDHDSEYSRGNGDSSYRDDRR